MLMVPSLSSIKKQNADDGDGSSITCPLPPQSTTCDQANEANTPYPLPLYSDPFNNSKCQL